jgi:hypothetical protein
MKGLMKLSKARGKLQVTEELIRKVLQLPEGVVISDAEFNSNRDIITLHLRSDEAIENYTMELPEGHESPVANHYFSKE